MSRSEDNCAWIRGALRDRGWTETVETFAWTVFCLRYFDVILDTDRKPQ